MKFLYFATVEGAFKDSSVDEGLEKSRAPPSTGRKAVYYSMLNGSGRLTFFGVFVKVESFVSILEFSCNTCQVAFVNGVYFCEHWKNVHAVGKQLHAYA